MSWDADASIIAASLERESIPFRQETTGEGLQRFFYPRGEARRVAELIDRLADRTPGLDWDRFFPPDRSRDTAKPERDAKPRTAGTANSHEVEAKAGKPALKTKAETVRGIRSRAAERVRGTSRTAPKPFKTRTR